MKHFFSRWTGFIFLQIWKIAAVPYDASMATAKAIGSKIKDHNNSWPQVLNLRPLDEKYAV